MKTYGTQPIRLGRRDFLLRGSAGVLGTIIAAGTANIAGAQTVSADTVMANLKALKMGDFNPSYANQWAYRLAQGLGYLEEVGIEGLEVVLTDEYIPGLVGGSLDIAHGDTSAFMGAAVASGLPITMISMHRDKEWRILGVRAGIETVEDLRGGTITGGNPASRNAWVMRQVLIELGLDPDVDMSFVPASGGSDARLGALVNGTVDAASVFPRHEAPLVASGGKFLFESLNVAPQEGFAVMGDWLDANHDTAQAWVMSDLRARQWLFDPANKDRAYQIMVDFGFEITDDFRGLYSVELDQLSPDCGFESAEAMDSFIADLAQTGDVPADIVWRDHMDMTLVWAAQDALGLPRRPASL